MSVVKSFAELGLQYEHQVQRFLARLRFHTKLVGGRGDEGIDLKGHWIINRRQAFVQCKNITSPCAPVIVREFEGVASRLNGQLGILVCSMPLSDQARVRMEGSEFSLMFLNLPFIRHPQPDGKEYGNVQEVIMSKGWRASFPELIVAPKMVGPMVDTLTLMDTHNRLEKYSFVYKKKIL